MVYTSIDYARMMWRNADGVIRCLQNGEVDAETAQRLTLQLNAMQDTIARIIAIIRTEQDQPQDNIEYV